MDDTYHDVGDNHTVTDISPLKGDDLPDGHMRVTSEQGYSAANVLARHMGRSDLPGRVAYHASLLAQLLQPVADAYTEASKRTNEEFGLCGEDGELLLLRNEQGETVSQTSIDPRQQTEYDAAVKEYSDVMFEIKWDPTTLKGSDLAERAKGKKKQDAEADLDIPFGILTFYHLTQFLDMTEYEED